jgi:putative spermidine/putrescine transport system substrate-binding protein
LEEKKFMKVVCKLVPSVFLALAVLGSWAWSETENRLASKTEKLMKMAKDRVVIQYDNIPNYANWGEVTQAYRLKTGVIVPPDMKGSSAALAALEAEQAKPQADCAYYSGAIGYQAAQKGLHASYKPAGWDRIPDGLKDPEGKWFTVHTATIAFIVNLPALNGKPIPQTWDDLLKPEYQGMIAYDDPTWGGTSFTMVYGLNALKGGSAADFKPGLEYLKKLDANVLNYPRDSIYNDVLRGEIPIWINADGNGLKMKHVDGGDVEVVIPKDGSVSMPLVMGMVKGAPNEERVKAYLDWLLTEEAQALFAKAFFRPVIPGSMPQEIAAKFPPDEDYKAVRNLDLAEMSAAADELKKAWLKEVRGNR